MTNKIHLYTTYYNEKDSKRKKELIQSLKRNINNSSVSSITILNEGDDLSTLSSKIINIPIKRRPSYNDFFQVIKQNKDKEAIHIIANTDIYFDKNIDVLNFLNLHNVCLALSRWDTTIGDHPLLFNHNDSQDVWIFKGPIKETLKVDYPLGVARCDNRFMYDLEQAGYNVSNPSFSIRAYHLHQGQREVIYTEADNKFNITPPYRYKYPHNQFSLMKTWLFNATHQHKLGRYRYDVKKINYWFPIKLIRKAFKTLTGYQLPLWGYK